MGENREYFTQALEDGALHISEDVVTAIAAEAAMEVEGVCGLSANLGSDLADMVGKKSLTKSIKISTGENEALFIECNVVVLYGHPVIAIAKSIQEAVASAVKAATGLQVEQVNVNICGISMGKVQKKG